MIMIPEHSNDMLKLHISDDGDDHMINCFQETLAKHNKYYIIKLDNHHVKYVI